MIGRYRPRGGGGGVCKEPDSQIIHQPMPMLVTAQQKLQFKPEDQPAMDRRLRNYTLKSLPEAKN